MPNSRILFFKGPSAASRAAAFIATSLVVGVLASAAVACWYLRGWAVDAAQVSAEDHAVALSSHARQVLSAGSFVLDGIVQGVSALHIDDSTGLWREMDTRDEYQRLLARQQSFEPILVVAVLDEAGNLVASSSGFPTQRVNSSDREAFIAAKNGVAGATYVTAPVLNRTNNRWVFHLSRRLESTSGEFLGVGLVGFSCEYFSSFYAQFRMDRRQPSANSTAMTLLRDDLTVLARAPLEPAGLGRPLPLDGPYRGLKTLASTNPQPVFRPWDTEPAMRSHEILVARRVEGFPVQVAVALRDTQYLAGWRRQVATITGVAALAAILLTAASTIMVRVLRRREALLAESIRLRSEAEQASRAKSEFLATMSHEIRTPMNGILGTADLLVRSPLPERERTLAQTLLRSGRGLLAIINDILDLSKIEAGELVIDANPFDPAALLQEIQELFKGSALSKGLRLELDIADGVPSAVIGDAHRVRQVLGNLVSNAVKFSNRGRVRLGLVGGTDDVLRFEVEDQGVGIPVEARARVFQPFAQADGSIARRFGGTGLGLAISKRLVELMHGRIDFISHVGQGTTFWIELPLPAAEAPVLGLGEADKSLEFRFAHSGAMPLVPEPEVPSGVGQERHVLVVEDNPVNAMVVEAQLATLGCTCEVASDGEEALTRLRRGHYGLVLMDVMLPGISGTEVVRRWRIEEARGERRRLPIVALTANVLASNLDEVRRAGMDGFLAKPCTVDNLAPVLRRWLVPATVSSQQVETGASGHSANSGG